MLKFICQIFFILCLTSLPALAAANFGHSDQSSDEIQSPGFAANMCYENSRYVLRELVKRNVDIQNDARVLFISFFNHPKFHTTYYFHVVVQQGDVIWDGNEFDENGSIHSTPVRDYFRYEEMKQGTTVRVIPGDEYLQENRFYTYYYVGMPGASGILNEEVLAEEKIEVENRYPQTTLWEIFPFIQNRTLKHKKASGHQ